MKDSLSVVIVTKNRVHDLTECFGSLFSGSTLPEEIIVVDNNSTDYTRQLVTNLAAQAKTELRYVFSDRAGYPAIYNCGLRAAHGKWVAFIDDDCVADRDWVKQIKLAIVSQPRSAAIIGWCETYFPQNVFSQAAVLLVNDWKSRSILESGAVNNFDILDTKNIVYRKSFLTKNSLEFDEARTVFSGGAAQDGDLGLQIHAAGGSAFCQKKILIWHKDPTSWGQLMKKSWESGKSSRWLEKKWGPTRIQAGRQPAFPLSRLVADLAVKYKLSGFDQLRLWLVAKQILWLNRFIPALVAIPNYEK